MAKDTFDPSLNMIATGGQFGSKRRLGTYTIHYNAKVNRYYVTDDMDKSGMNTVSSGHMTIEDAVKANKFWDDYRLVNK